MEAALLKFLQWAVETGLLPAGTAVILIVFCALVVWVYSKQSKDFRHALSSIEVSHTRSIDEMKNYHNETVLAVKEQVEIKQKHNDVAEKRYEQLRTDMAFLQRQVAETNDGILKEVLAHLRRPM